MSPRMRLVVVEVATRRLSRIVALKLINVDLSPRGYI
jgi:hypothetical protein